MFPMTGSGEGPGGKDTSDCPRRLCVQRQRQKRAKTRAPDSKLKEGSMGNMVRDFNEGGIQTTSKRSLGSEVQLSTKCYPKLASLTLFKFTAM